MNLNCAVFVSFTIFYIVRETVQAFDNVMDNLIRANNDRRKLHFRLWLIHF
jgi:hypothetical protein